MRLTAQFAVLTILIAPCAPAQTATDQPKSLAEVARDSRKEKKDPAKIILSDETEPVHNKPQIPDVFSGGIDNVDEILKAIADYRSTHNLQETEAVVRLWYEKHDALLANAIEQNRRIEQRERDRQLVSSMSDSHPRTAQEFKEKQQVEMISRREDQMHKQENSLLATRIEHAFRRTRTQMKSKYSMNIEWFKICGNANCS
jgi:hypothetical protein